MKVSINDQEVFTLSETQKKVIMNDIPAEIFESDMGRRLRHILIDEKYTQCLRRLKEEWEPKLIGKGLQLLPTDPDAFAELVFSQPDYKDRTAREEDFKAARLAEIQGNQGEINE